MLSRTISPPHPPYHTHYLQSTTQRNAQDLRQQGNVCNEELDCFQEERSIMLLHRMTEEIEVSNIH